MGVLIRHSNLKIFDGLERETWGGFLKGGLSDFLKIGLCVCNVVTIWLMCWVLMWETLYE